MKILLTYFEPFDGRNENVSRLVVKNIEQTYDNIDVLSIPVSWEKAFVALKPVINKYNYIILCGEAKHRNNTMMEYIAINLMNANIPDNDGIVKINEKISNVEAYATKFDVFAISKKTNIEVSLSAGSYLCNYLYYKSLEYIEMNKLNSKCMFVHFPIPYDVKYENQLLKIIEAISKD